jgi:DNA (cytosine-5)-methyltransferase 1
MIAQQLRLQGITSTRLRQGEIAVDLFAGGGGASRGIELATGISPAVAINHDPAAIEMHSANHPDTFHYCESVFDVKPLDATQGAPVGLLWASPDCTHFSRAKGGKPRSQKIRGLAWIVVTWAIAVAPRIIHLENVPEFRTWGPLNKKGKPIKARAGETFREFIGQLEALGYVVEHQVLVAADYDTPTTRKRLFLTARRDGEPIVWATPTNGKSGKPKPWRTAAECIDWSLPCPSIFMTRAEARQWKRDTGQQVKRPLADATCRRIARGIVRYVLNGQPFIVQVAHGDHVRRPGDRVTGMYQPLGTTTKTNCHAFVAPTLIGIDQRGSGDSAAWRADQPMTTVTRENRHALVAPTLIQAGYSEREGQAPRVLDILRPMGAITAGGNKHALVAAFLAKHNGVTTGQSLEEPTHTIAGNINKAVIAAHLMVFRQNSRGCGLDEPMPTVTSGAGSVRPAGAAHAMAVVAAFLVQYYSSGGMDQSLDDPLATVVTKARHGLVTVTIDGAEYAIVDIGMRMLEPRELARAQGFDDSYVLTGTKSQQIARIGNSVCPRLAAAIIGANLDPVILPTRRRRKVAA